MDKEKTYMKEKRVNIKAYDSFGKVLWHANVSADADTVYRKMREYVDRGLIPVVSVKGQAQCDFEDASVKLSETLEKMKGKMDQVCKRDDTEEKPLLLEWQHDGVSFRAAGPARAVMAAHADVMRYAVNHAKGAEAPEDRVF